MVKPSMLGRLGRLFGQRPVGELILPKSTPLRLAENSRVAWNSRPFTTTLGHVELELHPDLGTDGEEQSGVREWFVKAGTVANDFMPKSIRIKMAQQARACIYGRFENIADEFGVDLA